MTSDHTPDTPEQERAEAYRAYALEFGHILKRARARTGLSQVRIAEIAGLSDYTYQKFEQGESGRGDPANPRLTTLLALSRALEIPLIDLFPQDPPDLTEGR